MRSEQTATEVRAILEVDLAWRLDEIRFLRNQVAALAKEDERKRLRRAVVVMLYAHLEGFTKTAIREYAKAVSMARIPCGEATAVVLASSIGKLFDALETAEKAPEFRAEEDLRIHKHWRRTSFVSSWHDRLREPLVLDQSIADPGSNLTPRVLKKMLFLAGLDPNLVQENHGIILELVEKRNDIAHGEAREGYAEKDYGRVETAVVESMERLMRAVETAVRFEIYRARPHP